MKKLIYIQDNFLDPSLCKPFIDLFDLKKEDRSLDAVTDLCKTFDPDIILDYVGVVRWPVGTFMKPHFDKNDVHGEDVFAAMLYLNDDFTGGSTCFEDFEVKPEIGKLIVFSNSQYLHYVSKVEGVERFVLSFWYNKLDKE